MERINLDCPFTDRRCPLAERILELEGNTYNGPRYHALDALKKLILLKRDLGDCNGSFQDTDEETLQILAEHCGTSNAAEIERMASTVGKAFGLSAKERTGITVKILK